METVEHSQAQRTERGGIPVWWADVPGPFFASMMFRAGQADETLATRGLTHLVEHLALFQVGRREHEYNGFVDDVRCVFYARGERDEVLEFLRLTAAALGDLPVDRLEAERRVLRSEASAAGDVVARLRGHRFGAAGYGLVNYHELGLRWLGPDEVTGWARERFTAGNTVLWMTGEPPGDLGLGLPPGERHPTPEPAAITMQHPAFIAEGTGGVVLTATPPRSTALRVLEHVAGERLYDRLRVDRGLAYAPYGSYLVLGADTAHLVLASDCSDDDAPVVIEEIWRTVGDIAAEGVTGEELDRYRRGVARSIAEPDSLRGELDIRAADELTGAEPYERAQWLAELEALQASDVAAAAAEVASTAILLGPEGSKAPTGSFCPFSPRAPEPVVARAYHVRVTQPGEPEKLMLDDRGISYQGPDGNGVTIEWDRCAAAERRPDGSLMLHSFEGGWLIVTPADWQGGDEILERMLSQLAPHLVIPAADAEVAEHVEQLAGRCLDEPQRVGGALAGLTSALRAGEEALDMAEGVAEGRTGLLALTDRRVLWLDGQGGMELPLAEISQVKVPKLKLFDGPITIVAEHGTVHVDVRPMSRARELAAAIEQRAP